MKRSKRMQPAVRVAQEREQAAARRFGEAQRILQENERRLAELFTYREEYRAMAAGPEGGTVSVFQFQQTRRFLDSLDHAIAQQERAIGGLREQSEQQRRAWLTARGKVKALENVVARCLAEEENEALRREQKEIDEWAQRDRK